MKKVISDSLIESKIKKNIPSVDTLLRKQKIAIEHIASLCQIGNIVQSYAYNVEEGMYLSYIFGKKYSDGEENFGMIGDIFKMIKHFSEDLEESNKEITVQQ